MSESEFNPDEFRETLGQREEITDIINDIKARYTPENFESLRIKKGRVLRFDYEGTPITIRVTRKAGDRYWGVHVELHDQRIVRSHTKHDVDLSSKPPFCNDCQVIVTEPATEDGEKKFQDREDRHLSDGTFIGDQNAT